MISLDLFGDPVSQARPRTFRQGNKTVTWNPQAKLKEGYKWQIRSQYRDEPITAPVSIDVIFHMPIPKGTSKVKERAMINGAIRHIKRPDCDNLLKFLLDVLNDVVIKDDAQVDDIHVRKIYSSKPGTYVRIMPIENQCKEPIVDAHNQRSNRQ